MKRSYWLGLAVLLLIFALPVIAKPEHLALGSYNVTFDAGKELQDWNITKKETETLMGSPELIYTANIANVSIKIQRYDFKGGEMFTGIDAWRKKAEEGSKVQGNVCTTRTRTIDGRDGLVGYEVRPDGEFYYAGWYLNNNTSVNVISSYPWDEGTLQLLKTINVTTTG